MNRRYLLLLEFDKWGFDQKGWSKNTRRNYFERARRADAWLVENGGRSLVTATTKDLEAFLFSTPPTARTRNCLRNALVGFGEFLVDRGFTDANPALGLPRLRVSRPLPKALPSEVIRAVEAAVPFLGARVTAMVMVFAYCGLRHAELQLLEWSNVHPDRWLRFDGKGSKERAVPIHERAWAALERWRLESDSARYVFPSTRRPDRPISSSWLLRTIREVGDMVGVERLHPHQLRHTVAAQLLDDGADTRDVQEFLGHASLSTTQIYTKIRPARLREAVARLDYSENGAAGLSETG